jgi:ADP-heptose:LPS heptosyltransferase
MTLPLPIWGAQAGQWLKLDCRHYRGDRPCAVGVQGVCPADCSAYDPMGTRILVIKLGALGDVVRTAALLPGLKARWPRSHITWVTRPNGVRMLAHQPEIDRLLPFDAETLCHLEHERFDVCFSLDKEPGPAALAMRVDARQRLGVGLSATGSAYPLNPECVNYFLLGLDDRAKFFENRKSYQQLLYEAVGLPYAGERYRLYPQTEQRRAAAAAWERCGLPRGEHLVALNTGAGAVFANKTWQPQQFAELARRLVSRPGVRVAVVGGPAERAINEQLQRVCPGVLDPGGPFDELTFAALLARAAVLVTGDTMALHVAVAQDVPVVALFGPTCDQEIDLYGRGEKLIGDVPCRPCYRRSCDKTHTCMEAIGVGDVEAAVLRWAGRGSAPEAVNRRSLPVLEGRP